MIHASCGDTNAAGTNVIKRLGLADIDSEAFQQILNGTFECLATCKPITKQLLQQLARPAGVEDHQPCT